MGKFNLDKLIRENLKALQPYSSARDEYVSDGSDMVFLDANENPFENGVNRYPDPQQRSLKAVLANIKKVKEGQILLGNGSDEVLDLIFRVFCTPQVDNIITVPPTYGMYKVLSGINAIENRKVRLTEDFQLNVKGILDRVDANTKIIFLCSPNNPTGNSLEVASIEILLNAFNGIVVIDEAYIDFSSNKSWINSLSNFPNIVVTQTLSKAYGLAGIRLGACYASEAIISVLMKIKPPYNVNELTQQKALDRVKDQNGVQLEVAKILKNRAALVKALKTVKFIKKIYPTDANFVLARVDDADRRYQQLLEKGVVVRNRSNQPLCHNTLRFTVGTATENEKLIQELNTLNKEA